MKRIGSIVIGGVGLLGALGLAPAAARGQGASCGYQGAVYSDGALSCQRGVQVQCLDGRWVSQEETCTEQYGGAGGQLRMESGAEQPAPTDDPMPSDSDVAPPDPNPGDY